MLDQIFADLITYNTIGAGTRTASRRGDTLAIAICDGAGHNDYHEYTIRPHGDNVTVNGVIMSADSRTIDNHIEDQLWHRCACPICARNQE